MTTTTPTAWNWKNQNGAPMTVTPTGWPDGFEWFAEGPGQRPPTFYELRSTRTGATEVMAVFPVEPWSAYDAAGDKLRGRGWSDCSPVDHELCEHGLAAAMCYGPGHYSDEV